jgi:two-component system CheB/CheR fusion protein
MSEQSSSLSVAGLRVLIVDDTPDTLGALHALLGLEGASVLTASGAAEALRILDERPVDLVLSDISMADMDGHAFVGELRRRPGYAAVPAIALSGHADPSDVRRSLDSGFDAHLAKPVLLEHLVETMARLMRRRCDR